MCELSRICKSHVRVNGKAHNCASNDFRQDCIKMQMTDIMQKLSVEKMDKSQDICSGHSEVQVTSMRNRLTTLDVIGLPSRSKPVTSRDLHNI